MRAAACIVLTAALAAGCNARTRHKTLTLFFDGVPPQKVVVAGTVSTTAPAPGAAATGPPGTNLHGPFAAKLCSACHNAAATNALVLPKDQLCLQCHQLKQDVKYVHGPLASGGCLVCHEPHSSPYRFLLVSDSDSFCFRCHDREAISTIEEHASPEANCTICHNAHGSDHKYMLR